MRMWLKGYRLFFCLLVFIFLSSCQDKGNQEIVKSSRDQNSYKFITLENGLKAILVSYPDTETAAAALTVGVGSFDDPATRPGLAHYLEHMLFLGTEKYPNSDEYQEFISKHGGSHNAYTASENTTYYFSINSEQLEPGLDRFAQFFIAPLFNEEYVDRERHAVDSEYKMHLKNDSMRIYHAIKSIINPKHPMSKFNVGSLDTLSNENNTLRNDVQKFYNEKYDAYRMYLSIVGPQDIATLEQYARKMFSSIKSKCPCPTASGMLPDILTEKQMAKDVNIKSLNDSKSFSLLFKIPNQLDNYKDSPIKYVEYLISSSADGGLYKNLKEKNYISGMSIGYSEFGKTDALFEIEYTLTDSGEKNKLEILQDSFNYIAWLKEHGIEKWLYEQQKKIDLRSFEFSDRVQPIGLAINLSTLLRNYPARDILTINLLRPESKFPSGEIKTILNKLTPQNMILLNVSSSVETDKVEEFFGTEYSIKKIDVDLLSKIDSKRSNNWALPKENHFIPENFNIIKNTEEQKAPTLISSENDNQFWHLNLSKFNLPHIEMGIKLLTPLSNGKSVNYAMSDIFSYVVSDNLSTYSTMLSDAGIYININNTRTGISVQISSYRDNADRAIAFALQQLLQSSVTRERFKSLKSNLIDSYKDYKNKKPFEMAISEADTLLVKGSYTNDEILAAIEDIEYEDFVKYSEAIKGSFVKVVTLVEGNINNEDVKLYQKIIDRYITINKQFKEPVVENVIVPEGTKYWEVHPADKSSRALISFFPTKTYSNEVKAKLLLLGNVISSPFYDKLRTKQQVGYVVAARANSAYKQLGLQFIIQSPTNEQLDLLNRIRTFIIEEYKDIEKMSTSELDHHKNGIRDNLLEKPKNIAESFNDHWNLIGKKEFDFEQHEKVAAAVMEITKEDLLSFYREVLIDNKTNIIVVNDVHNLESFEKIETIRGLG